MKGVITELFGGEPIAMDPLPPPVAMDPLPPPVLPPPPVPSPPVPLPPAPPSSPAPAPASPALSDVAAAAAARCAAGRPLVPPRSGIELERAWAAAVSDETQLALLQAVAPESLPGLLRNGLTAPLLAAIATASCRLLAPRDAARALATLRGLAATPRFATAAAMLSGAQRAMLAGAWLEGEAAAGEARDDLAALRGQFRVPA